MKARQAKPSAPKKIKLSQCMIVKNEEKNIKRALEWAKDIAFEQIVVDTGSTDKTVEIAKEMGAKVYHFEWIDDFSAAKNYAIEQASGDWIAFLDADEYMTKEDAGKLYKIISEFDDKEVEVIRFNLSHLSKDEKIMAVYDQDRVFKNTGYIRYHNRIHEQIERDDKKGLFVLNVEDIIKGYHTGYAQDVYIEKNKAERNSKLLKREVNESPENYNAWSYLAESLCAEGKFEEAEECAEKALNADFGNNEINKYRHFSAMQTYLRIAVNTRKSEQEVLRRAEIAGYPNDCRVNIYYYMAIYYLNTNQDYKAFTEFERYIDKLNVQKDVTEFEGDLSQVYIWLTELSRRLNKDDKVVYYGVLALRTNKYLDGVLTAMLMCLSKDTDSAKAAQSTFDFLQKIYDFTNKKDLYLVFKCAKVSNFKSLENKLIPYFSQKELDVLYSDK